MLDYLLPKYQPSPRVSTRTDNGKPIEIRVTIAALSALSAIVRDLICVVTVVILTITAICYCLVSEQSSAWPWIAALSLPTATYPLLYAFTALLLAKRKTLTFRQDGIRFKQWFFTKNYDPSLSLQFMLAKNSRAGLERQWHEHCSRKDQLEKRSRRHKQYFQNCYYLILIHPQGNSRILTIYDEPHAIRCLNALSAAKTHLDGMSRTGTGITLNPELEWQDHAGGLPQAHH